LNLKTGITMGTTCGANKDCPANNIQFCQENSQCPTGQRCVPVKFAGQGNPPSMATFALAVCAK
jgi:Cys-rich repeat protein